MVIGRLVSCTNLLMNSALLISLARHQQFKSTPHTVPHCAGSISHCCTGLIVTKLESPKCVHTRTETEIKGFSLHQDTDAVGASRLKLKPKTYYLCYFAYNRSSILKILMEVREHGRVWLHTTPCHTTTNDGHRKNQYCLVFVNELRRSQRLQVIFLPQLSCRNFTPQFRWQRTSGRGWEPNGLYI
jgi:hypothetical protein